MKAAPAQRPRPAHYIYYTVAADNCMQETTPRDGDLPPDAQHHKSESSGPYASDRIGFRFYTTVAI